jgi:hypothetical protein
MRMSAGDLQACLLSEDEEVDGWPVVLWHDGTQLVLDGVRIDRDRQYVVLEVADV